MEWWLKTPVKTPNYSFCLDKANHCRTSKVLMDNDCNQGKNNTVTCSSHTVVTGGFVIIDAQTNSVCALLAH